MSCIIDMIEIIVSAANLGLVNRLVTVYRKFQVRCQKILTHAHNLYAQQVLEQRTCTCWQRTGNFLYQHFKGRCDSLVYQILPSPFYPHFIYNIPFMGVFYSSYPLWIAWVNGLTLVCRQFYPDKEHQFPKPYNTKDRRSQHSNLRIVGSLILTPKEHVPSVKTLGTCSILRCSRITGNAILSVRMPGTTILSVIRLGSDEVSIDGSPRTASTSRSLIH